VENLPSLSKLDDDALADLAYQALSRTDSSSFLFSGSRLERISSWLVFVRRSADKNYTELISVLNDEGLRGDIMLATALLAPLGKLLGVETGDPAEMAALALLLARIARR
jgi:hypothetical protein